MQRPVFTNTLKRLNRKEALTPAQKRESAAYLIKEHKISPRQACKMLNLRTSVMCYKPNPKDDTLVIDRLTSLADGSQGIC
jgi:hypothetical protein